MPKIDIEAAPTRFGRPYPPPLDETCKGLRRWKLGAAAGLTQFGVNLTRVSPGQWTSQRHWHTAEDEFVWVIEGEAVLIEIGSRRPGEDACYYPDHGVIVEPGLKIRPFSDMC